MNKAQALNSFWNGFDLKAYDENSVPDGAQLPYITYESVDGEFNRRIAATASIWCRSSSWEEITLKEMEIADRIGLGGILVPYDGGSIWICKGAPWAQRMSDTDDTIRRIVLNVELEFIGG